MQKIYNFIVLILLVLLVGSFTGLGVQSYRLVKTRQQLDAIRVEYAEARGKQSELREIVRGTNEILSESSNTISGIRSQIAIIRESYEAMENILSGNNNSSDK